MIGLVGLLMVSSLHRVAMYVGEYGLTEIRLYATVFMVWVGAVQLILLTTVLRGDPQRFAFRSVLAGLSVLVILNLSNPEALIARSQIARSRGGAAVDVNYISKLSADATPTIAANLERLSVTDACDLYHLEFDRFRRESQVDWRSWNLGRSRAHAAAAAADVTIWVSCTPSGSS